MPRRIFLYLSRSRTLRKWMEGSNISRNITRRFVAGETLQQELDVCRRLHGEGIFSTLDHLGENVSTLAEASASCDVYMS
ncbi:MAG: proline dehydrogenase, partial [Bryobacteraceae bacterium]